MFTPLGLLVKSQYEHEPNYKCERTLDRPNEGSTQHKYNTMQTNITYYVTKHDCIYLLRNFTTQESLYDVCATHSLHEKINKRLINECNERHVEKLAS